MVEWGWNIAIAILAGIVAYGVAHIGSQISALVKEIKALRIELNGALGINAASGASYISQMSGLMHGISHDVTAIKMLVDPRP